jgi:hypothetical protein
MAVALVLSGCTCTFARLQVVSSDLYTVSTPIQHPRAFKASAH